MVDQQRAKVDAAQRAVDAAQAKVDASVNQAATSGPYNGHDLNDNNPLARELFDARHNLVEQRNLLQDMNAAAAETGGRQVPVPVLPENADRQAFAPGPSLAERAATGVPEGLTTGSRVIHDITGGLVPDVAKGIHTGTHWGEASPADGAQLIGDAAGMVPLPGMKIAGEASEHGLAQYGAEALAHGAPPVVGSHVPVGGEHGGSVHAPDVPVSGDHGVIGHGGDAAAPQIERHSALEDMLLGGHHDPGGAFDGGMPEPRPYNDDIKGYPHAYHPGTGAEMPFPSGDLERIPANQRSEWTNMDRYYYIKQWHDMGYETPSGGWNHYDIHHVKPREFGGDNSFENLIPVPRSLHNQRITPWWNNYGH